MEVKGLTVRFSGLTVFENAGFSFPDGRITCVMGPSGCGKTTLLNSLAGFYGVPAAERTSYIFQEPRLLPWLHVLDNVTAALPDEMSAAQKNAIAEKYLGEVGLGDFTGYYPAQLSGGMRQRVSLARAFAAPCGLLLMDEPFNGQDIRTKRDLIRLFNRLWNAEPKTVVAVTHDFSEAWNIGDGIVVLSERPAVEKARLIIDAPRDGREGSEDSEAAVRLKKAAEAAIFDK